MFSFQLIEMISCSSVGSILENFIKRQVNCSDELVAEIFRFSFPTHASVYKSSKYKISSDTTVHLHRDALYLESSKELLIYPRVISSSDTRHLKSWDYLSSCSSASRVFRAALLCIQETIHSMTTPSEVWRVWISFGEAHDHIYLYLTLSDPFKRVDFSFVLDQDGFEPVATGLYFDEFCFHLSRGIFTVNGTKYETQGKFVYNFISRIVALTDFILFYAEAGQLIRICVDHTNRTASAKLQPLVDNPTVINIFPWPEQCVGALVISPTGHYSIRVVTCESREIMGAPQLEDISNFKLFGVAMDSSRRIHLLPVDSDEIVLLTPEYDTAHPLR